MGFRTESVGNGEVWSQPLSEVALAYYTTQLFDNPTGSPAMDDWSRLFAPNDSVKVPLLLTKGKREPQRSLAALPFEIKGDPSLKHLALAIPEVIGSQISQLAPVSLVERIRINKIFKEWELQIGDAIDATKTVEIGNLEGAQMLLLGSCTKVGDNFVISARVVETATSKVLASADLDADASALSRAPFHLSRVLAAALKNQKEEEPNAAEDLLAPDAKTFENFGKAMEEEFNEEYEKAAKLYSTIIQEDPTFTPAHQRLSLSASGVAGNELYKQALDKAMKKNKAALKEIKRFQKIWDASQKLLQAIRNGKPKVEISNTSEVHETEVLFKITLKLTDPSFEKPLEAFLKRIGISYSSKKPRFEDRVLLDFQRMALDAGNAEDKYTLTALRVMKAIADHVLYKHQIRAVAADGTIIRQWDVARGYSNNSGYEWDGGMSRLMKAALWNSPMGGYRIDGFDIRPAVTQRDVNFRGNDQKNSTAIFAWPNNSPYGYLRLPLSEVKQLKSFEASVEYNFLPPNPFGGDTILTPEGWKKFLKNYWQENSVAIPE